LVAWGAADCAPHNSPIISNAHTGREVNMGVTSLVLGKGLPWGTGLDLMLWKAEAGGKKGHGFLRLRAGGHVPQFPLGSQSSGGIYSAWQTLPE
jgi:hypothetical protein